MSANIRALKARKTASAAAARELMNTAAAASRDLSVEEQATFDRHAADIRAANVAIEREELIADAEAGMGAGGVVVPAKATITVTENVAEDPKRGFKSFGDFAASVKRAAVSNSPEQRLVIGAAAPTTTANESSGEDGGWLIPPEFSKAIWALSLEEDSLINMADNTPVVGNSMVFPQDETTPWGTDGVRAYWQAEASVATATKPKIFPNMMRLNKLMALVPITSELMDDQGALQAYITPLVARSIRWKANEAVLAGSGAGVPLGVRNSDALVTVAKESGQAANTLLPMNIANMIARLPAGSYGRAIWLINNEVLPSLFTLTLGNYPMYVPLGAGSAAMAGSPYGMLLGRPVFVTQHAEAFSSAGDLQLHDFSYYRTITKSGAGIETATSMHLYFDADAVAFRSTFRFEGRPKLKSAITPAKGTKTLSPFIQLGAR